MGIEQTDFQRFLRDETAKYRGVMVPVRASLPERVLMRFAPASWLHPNPDDEFCNPSIGPNYQIISRYERVYREERTMRPGAHDERLMVEKVHPDGYMILNGHHRWVAGLRVGFRWMPVTIVNLTQETDIKKMLENSQHDRRVTLDLDEVVFSTDGMPSEKLPGFPYKLLYKKPLRLGVPALLHFLSMSGYDVWVYTAGYVSFESIQAYFRRYSAKVDGIITGTSRKTSGYDEVRKRTEQLFAARYSETLHIDNHTVLRTFRDGREYEEYEIGDSGVLWSQKVMDIIKGLGGHEENHG